MWESADVDRRWTHWHPAIVRSLPWTRAVALLGAGLAACASTDDNGLLGTVELGDNFIAPELQLSDELFYCRIQPEVLTEHSCASGQAGEAGGCHDSQSALRLVDTEAPPPCDADATLVEDPPDAYRQNLEAVRFSVQSDALSSPLYLRPLNRASHPRAIFDEDDAAAELILEWITAGTR